MVPNITDCYAPCFEFIEQMSLLTEANGLSKIAAQLMGLMIVAKDPLSLNQITEILAVSKASVSNNTRLLESMGLVERVCQHGDRQTYYQLTVDPYTKLIEGRLNHFFRAEQVLANARQKMVDPLHKQRLEALENFNKLMITIFQQTLRQLGDGLTVPDKG